MTLPVEGLTARADQSVHAATASGTRATKRPCELAVSRTVATRTPYTVSLTGSAGPKPAPRSVKGDNRTGTRETGVPPRAAVAAESATAEPTTASDAFTPTVSRAGVREA